MIKDKIIKILQKGNITINPKSLEIAHNFYSAGRHEKDIPGLTKMFLKEEY